MARTLSQGYQGLGTYPSRGSRYWYGGTEYSSTKPCPIFASGWSIDSAYLSRNSTSSIVFANQVYMTAHTYSTFADKVGEGSHLQIMAQCTQSER